MRLILVGGFLGAGKTTLLAEAAKRLAERGHRVGLITNDQAPNLVDTAMLRNSGASVREVAGSCFCCDFNGFEAAAQSLVAAGADAIVSEPVGSCTDLSATIVQPMKAEFAHYNVAPLTVLVDPKKALALLHSCDSLLQADAAYIFRLQLEEADIIALSKTDTISAADRDSLAELLSRDFPQARVVMLSSLSGEGVDAWLDSVLADTPAGQRVIDVDYDRYANGEAVLGWLNAHVSLRWTDGIVPDWTAFAQSVIGDLHKSLEQSQSEVGHIKLLLETSDGTIAANLTGLRDDEQYRCEGLLARLNASLLFNARVQMAPERLEFEFREALAAASYARVAPTIRAFHCIRPGRPVPTYRYTAVV